MKTPIRILLSEAASKHLETAGAECFVIVAKDKSDAHSGRMVIHLMPCSYKAANAAVRVAQGLSTEKMPKPASTHSNALCDQAGRGPVPK